MKTAFLLLLLSGVSVVKAQTEMVAYIRGRVIADTNGISLADIHVSIPYLKVSGITNTSGIFELREVPYGRYTFIVSNGVVRDSLKVLVDTLFIDLGNIVFKPGGYDNAFIGSRAMLLDNNTDEDGVNDPGISGLLYASTDPYVATAALNFSNFRFRPRGYDRNRLEVYFNGLPMHDLATGVALAGQWSGLNEIARNRRTAFGLRAAEAGFGGLSGAVEISAFAALQPKQTQVAYLFTNRIYRHRVMLSHSSGLSVNGWAYAVAFSKRWAKEGYVPGTSYDGYAVYAAVSRKIKRASMLHFTLTGAATESARASPVTSEAMGLASSHFYNPDWGYDSGRKRNAKVNRSFQPVFMLNYDYKPDYRTKLSLALSYQKGYNSNSVLDWYNAEDPRPDNYKRLPGYYENDEATADPAVANSYRNKWLSDEGFRQIEWDALYAANRLNNNVVNGVSGKRSVYMVGADRDDIMRYNFAANLQKKIHENINLNIGLLFAMQETESYRKMLDLLGGDYYVNLNQFAERTYPGNVSFSQNDLNRPDGIVMAGDKYAYDYKARLTKAFAWGQLLYSKGRADFFIAARLVNETFQREGIFRNGLFPDASYGASKRQAFLNYQCKSGISYKLNGRNYLFVNVALQTDAPLFDDVFVAPRISNTTITGITVSKVKSIEGGYMLHTKMLKGRLTGFATSVHNAADIKRFYHEDFNTFVNYAMRNVSTQYIGAEFALQARLTAAFSVTVVASWMQAFYTSDPEISIYRDNDTAKRVPGSTAYLKNLYIDAGPQSAYALGLSYRSQRRWHASVQCNYLHRNFISVNPGRRTAEVLGIIGRNSERWHTIADQQVLDPVFTVDFFAGKSLLLKKVMVRLPESAVLNINVGVNNLLNNRNIPVAGFEQLRFDVRNKNPERFAPKYTFAFGATYFVSAALKF